MSHDTPERAEMRAMILLTLPYPPLPLLAARVEADDGRLQEDGVITSHTLIARALDESMARNNPAENTQRKARQIDVFQRFLHVMGTDGFFSAPERVYQIYCAFTIEHIATYFPPGHPLDIRFQPFASICKGDPVHAKIAEYLAAQSLFFEDPITVSREQYMRQDLVDLLRVCRDRLGHVLTSEERARLLRLEET